MSSIQRCVALSKPFNLSVSRNFVLLILSVIVAIASISLWAINSQQNENAQREVIISKLDTLQNEAKEPQNLTVHILTNNHSIKVPENGKISSLDGMSVQILNSTP